MLGAKVVYDGQVLVVANYLSSENAVFLQTPENYKPDPRNIGTSLSVDFATNLTIRDLESATGRTWIGTIGLLPSAMKSYSSVETALVALKSKVGHRVARAFNKFYVVPVQAMSLVDAGENYITALDGERYINADIAN